MRSLGIDIGTTNVKVVELNQSGGEVRLENYGLLETYGYLDRPNAAIQSSYFKIVEEITADLLKKLFTTFKPKTKKAVLSLPIFSSFVTVFELPLKEEKDIMRAIPFEAKKYIPVALDDLEIDWAIVGQSGEGSAVRSQILLIAIPKEIIEKYKKIGKVTGLDVEVFELESVALARALIGQDKNPVIVADIGSQSTSLITVDNGYLVANESLTVAGSEITHVISQSLGVAKERAEEFKRIKGFNVEPQEAEVVNLMLPIIDYFGNEIHRAVGVFKEKTQRDIQRVILSGGTANLPGLDNYLSQYLNIKVEKAWPFNKVQFDQFTEPLLRDVGPSLSVAVGLALRGLY